MLCQAMKEPETALATDLPGTVDYYVFNSETIPRLLAVSFGLSYVNMTCT